VYLVVVVVVVVVAAVGLRCELDGLSSERLLVRLLVLLRCGLGSGSA
jgi:hypothetical protein